MFAHWLALALVWNAPAFAAEPTGTVSEAAKQAAVTLYGPWFRVYERCTVPLEGEPKFSADGGDAQVGRRMILTFGDGTFRTTTMNSLRCGTKDAAPRSEHDSQTIDCDAHTDSRGTLKVG